MKIKNKVSIVALMLLVSILAFWPVNATAAGIGQPDLKIVSFGATLGGSPESAVREVTLSWIIVSTGRKATGPFVAELKNSNTVIQTFTYQSLDPKKGAGSVSGQKIVSLAPGIYDFTFEVDSTEVVDETNENNNIATVRVIVPRTPVVKTIVVSPASVIIEVGKTQILNAEARDQYGDIIPAIISWETSSNSVSISSSGLLTGSYPGSGIVVASNGTVRGSATVTVTAPTIVDIAVGYVYYCCSSAPSPLYPPGQTAFVRDPVGVSFDANNKGSQTIGSVHFVVRLNGNVIMEMDSGSIPPGGVIHIKEMSNYVFDIPGYNEITVEAIVPDDIDPCNNMGKIGVYVQELMLPDLVVSECQAINAGAAMGVANVIGFQCHIGNTGIAPAFDFLFEAVTNQGKIIHSERFNLNPGEWQLIARSTNEPFPITEELGIGFMANGDQRIQELTFGNNMQYVRVYPAVPVPG